MLVKDVMTEKVVAIGSKMPIADAHALMEQRNIRHFPIVEEGDSRLVGIISDRDIRLVGSEHPQARRGVRFKDEVRRIMVAPVVTAHPLDPVEEAAKVLRERRIGAMPVLEEERLVGIVTATDLLDALVAMTGVLSPSARLELELPPQPGALAKLIDRIAAAGFGVSSVLSTQFEADAVTVVLRVGTINPQALSARLRAEGFSVLWPLEP